MVLIWTLVLLAVWLAWVGHGTTIAAFESSEGQWSDREVPTSGHDLRAIRVNFEEFKQACGRLSATTYRTTARNPLNVLGWWNYAIDQKWALPYRKPQVVQVPASSCD